MTTADLIAGLNDGTVWHSIVLGLDGYDAAATRALDADGLQDVYVYHDDVIRFYAGQWGQNAGTCQGGFAGCHGTGPEVIDPFRKAVYDEHEPMFLCDPCHSNRTDEI